MSLAGPRLLYVAPIAFQCINMVTADTGSLDSVPDSSDDSSDSNDSKDSDSKDDSSNNDDTNEENNANDDAAANTNTNTNTANTDTKNTAKDTKTTQWWTPTDTQTKTGTDTKTTKWWTPSTMTTDTKTTKETDTTKKETTKDEDNSGVTYNQYGFTGDQSKWIPESLKTDLSESDDHSSKSVKENSTSSANRNIALFGPEKDFTIKKTVLITALLGLSACFTIM